MVVDPSDREILVVLKVSVKPLSQSYPMEMRDFLDRAGKMCAWRSAIAMFGKCKRAVWVERMVVPLGSPTRIP